MIDKRKVFFTTKTPWHLKELEAAEVKVRETIRQLRNSNQPQQAKLF